MNSRVRVGRLPWVGNPLGDSRARDRFGCLGPSTALGGQRAGLERRHTVRHGLRLIDQARRLHVAAPLARPTVWPYRPIPGSTMWDQAIGIGYAPPEAIEEWGSIGEYHLDETWLGKIPPRVAEARKMYHHYVSLDCGLTRGFRGFWERRAGRRLADGSHLSLGARLEARLFHHLWRLRRALLGGR